MVQSTTSATTLDRKYSIIAQKTLIQLTACYSCHSTAGADGNPRVGRSGGFRSKRQTQALQLDPQHPASQPHGRIATSCSSSRLGMCCTFFGSEKSPAGDSKKEALRRAIAHRRSISHRKVFRTGRDRLCRSAKLARDTECVVLEKGRKMRSVSRDVINMRSEENRSS